jgi:hypothetical protein
MPEQRSWRRAPWTTRFSLTPQNPTPIPFPSVASVPYYRCPYRYPIWQRRWQRRGEEPDSSAYITVFEGNSLARRGIVLEGKAGNVGTLAGLLPAVLAYRTEVAENLAPLS